jgi:hypothetical protein
MKLNTDTKTTERVEPKVGLTPAVLSGIVDLGTQETNFGAKRQVMLTWELPLQTHVFDDEKGAQPLVRNKTYTMSLHEKSGLRKAIRGITGKDVEGEFELFDLLGANCMLNLIEAQGNDGKMYINIDSITPLMDGMTKAQPQEIKKFSLDEFDMNDYMSLYGWVQDKIKASPEYKKLNEQEAAKEAPKGAEEMPF